MTDETDGSVVPADFKAAYGSKVYRLQPEWIPGRAVLFNSDSVISGRWEGDNERQCTIESR